MALALHLPALLLLAAVAQCQDEADFTAGGIGSNADLHADLNTYRAEPVVSWAIVLLAYMGAVVGFLAAVMLASQVDTITTKQTPKPLLSLQLFDCGGGRNLTMEDIESTRVDVDDAEWDKDKKKKDREAKSGKSSAGSRRARLAQLRAKREKGPKFNFQLTKM